jgi:hypothetical protein
LSYVGTSRNPAAKCSRPTHACQSQLTEHFAAFRAPAWEKI